MSILQHPPFLQLLQNYISIGDIFHLVSTCHNLHHVWSQKENVVAALNMKKRVRNRFMWVSTTGMNPFKLVWSRTLVRPEAGLVWCIRGCGRPFPVERVVPLYICPGVTCFSCLVSGHANIPYANGTDVLIWHRAQLSSKLQQETSFSMADVHHFLHVRHRHDLSYDAVMSRCYNPPAFQHGYAYYFPVRRVLEAVKEDIRDMHMVDRLFTWKRNVERREAKRIKIM